MPEVTEVIERYLCDRLEGVRRTGAKKCRRSYVREKGGVAVDLAIDTESGGLTHVARRFCSWDCAVYNLRNTDHELDGLASPQVPLTADDVRDYGPVTERMPETSGVIGALKSAFGMGQEVRPNGEPE